MSHGYYLLPPRRRGEPPGQLSRDPLRIGKWSPRAGFGKSLRGKAAKISVG